MRRITTAALLAAALAASAGPTMAQYKWIGPDGSVNYGDRPPTTDAQSLKTGARPEPAAVGDPNLPYALRMPARKSPVTLYAGEDCEPCQSARAHLAKRGIPFSERLIRTPADLEAFKKLGFADSMMPAVAVGSHKQTGYEPGSWDAALDAAGYPKSSMLPAGYQAAAPETLTRPKAQSPAASAAVSAARPPADPVRRVQPVAPPPASASASSIRF
jgi:hypothetical protein